MPPDQLWWTVAVYSIEYNFSSSKACTQIDCQSSTNLLPNSLSGVLSSESWIPLPPPNCLARSCPSFNESRNIQIQLRLYWPGLQCVCVGPLTVVVPHVPVGIHKHTPEGNTVERVCEKTHVLFHWIAVFVESSLLGLQFAQYIYTPTNNIVWKPVRVFISLLLDMMGLIQI